MLMDAGAAAVAAAADQAARVPWWALPSTMANRACRPGEGPAGTVGSAQVGAQGVRATRVPGCHPPGSRQRRDGLLRRLLKADVDRYYSAILQCVRYMVATDFFRLERPALPEGARAAAPAAAGAGAAPVGGLAEVASGAAAALQEACAEPMEVDEELDDADIAELADVLV